MATSATDPPVNPQPESATPVEPRRKLYRLSVRDYRRAIDAGILTDTRLELLGGILVRQMGKSNRSNYPLIALPAAFRSVVPAEWLVLTGVSLRVGRCSCPEPDILIVPGPAARYATRIPRAREAALVIQIAEASYPLDRGFKWRRYAAAKIPIYWILNLTKNRVEIFREPTGIGSKATYQVTEIYGPDTVIPLVVAGVEVGRLAARDVFPHPAGVDSL